MLVLTLTLTHTGVPQAGPLWKLEAGAWEQLGTVPNRWTPAMVYDPVRKRMVFMGGQLATYQATADVQEWQFYDLSAVCPTP